jgi:hypothetical protein
MIFDDRLSPSTERESLDARRDAELYLRQWNRRALHATIGFFLVCAAVFPFSKGQSLHAYAEPFGRILVYVSMAAFVWLVISVGVALNSWFFLRALKRGKL